MKATVINSISKEEFTIFENASKIKIEIDDIEFRLSVNQFGDLVINKMNFGEGSTSIIIEPKVSNEIILK